LAMGAAGCGKRGDPLPPLQRIPTPVNRPRVSQQGQEIVIAWETPTGTVDGGALELREAEVLRRVVDPTPPPAPTPPSQPSDAEASSEAPSPPPAEGEPPPKTVVPEEVPSDVSVPPDVPAEKEEQTQAGAAVAILASAAGAASRQAGFASEATVIARIETIEPGERLEYRDAWSAEWQGMRLEYAVRHVNSRGRVSENSERSSLEPLPPIPAPSGLEAVADNGFVRLAWSGEPDGGPEPGGEPGFQSSDTLDFGFNVYRRRKGAASYPEAALNHRLLETARFEDRDVEFRREWCYTVRRVAVRREPAPGELAAQPDAGAVAPSQVVPAPEAADSSAVPSPETDGASAATSRQGGERLPQVPERPAVIESAGSPEACLTPIDTFAPAAPEGVVALGVTGGILLSWSPSDAGDLTGYRVYRAEREGGPFEPLTNELVAVPSHSDQGLAPGKTYFYAVSAVDGAEPANESARSVVVSAEVPE
ncbi:MAG: fibronectin type III domain-containing protein, partial [Vicinamibacteria bacterium]